MPSERFDLRREAVAATLQEHPEWNARKIAEATGIPEQAVRRALRSLRKDK